jgi:hypothetical protein
MNTDKNFHFFRHLDAKFIYENNGEVPTQAPEQKSPEVSPQNPPPPEQHPETPQVITETQEHLDIIQDIQTYKYLSADIGVYQDLLKELEGGLKNKSPEDLQNLKKSMEGKLESHVYPPGNVFQDVQQQLNILREALNDPSTDILKKLSGLKQSLINVEQAAQKAKAEVAKSIRMNIDKSIKGPDGKPDIQKLIRVFQDLPEDLQVVLLENAAQSLETLKPPTKQNLDSVMQVLSTMEQITADKPGIKAIIDARFVKLICDKFVTPYFTIEQEQAKGTFEFIALKEREGSKLPDGMKDYKPQLMNILRQYRSFVLLNYDKDTPNSPRLKQSGDDQKRIDLLQQQIHRDIPPDILEKAGYPASLDKDTNQRLKEFAKNPLNAILGNPFMLLFAVLGIIFGGEKEMSFLGIKTTPRNLILGTLFGAGIVQATGLGDAVVGWMENQGDASGALDRWLSDKSDEVLGLSPIHKDVYKDWSSKDKFIFYKIKDINCKELQAKQKDGTLGDLIGPHLTHPSTWLDKGFGVTKDHINAFLQKPYVQQCLLKYPNNTLQDAIKTECPKPQIDGTPLNKKPEDISPDTSATPPVTTPGTPPTTPPDSISSHPEAAGTVAAATATTAAPEGGGSTGTTAPSSAGKTSPSRSSEASSPSPDSSQAATSDLGNIEYNSNWSDTPLSVEEIQGIQPISYLGHSKDAKYYLVDVPNKGNCILRYNPNKKDDEVALLPVPNLDTAQKDWKGFISLHEQTQHFSDIEIKDSRRWKTLGFSQDFTTDDLSEMGLRQKLDTLESPPEEKQ